MSGRQDHTPLTDEQKNGFLELLAEGASIVTAAGTPSIRRKLYRLRDSDAAFAAEWAAAYREGTDALTSEARRRAVEGVEDVKVIGSGEFQREVPVVHYSDTLLMFLIKQRDPSYRDNSRVEVTGTGGGPVQVEHRGVKLSDILTAAREAGLAD